MANEEKQKIKATIILEMIGRPKEHLAEVMAKIIEEIGKEKGVKVTGKKDNEPKNLENKDKEGKVIEVSEEQMLYTTFSEVDLEMDDIFSLIKISFVYMPANIEIVSPHDFKFSNLDFGSLMNGVIAKLHNYDSVAKAAMMENQILARKLAQFSKPRLNIEPADQDDNGKKKSKK